jgi:hypothetical protein
VWDGVGCGWRVGVPTQGRVRARAAMVLAAAHVSHEDDDIKVKIKIPSVKFLLQ